MGNASVARAEQGQAESVSSWSCSAYCGTRGALVLGSARTAVLAFKQMQEQCTQYHLLINREFPRSTGNAMIDSGGNWLRADIQNACVRD